MWSLRTFFFASSFHQCHQFLPNRFTLLAAIILTKSIQAYKDMPPSESRHGRDKDYTREHLLVQQTLLFARHALPCLEPPYMICRLAPEGCSLKSPCCTWDSASCPLPYFFSRASRMVQGTSAVLSSFSSLTKEPDFVESRVSKYLHHESEQLRCLSGHVRSCASP